MKTKGVRSAVESMLQMAVIAVKCLIKVLAR
jgi:hypothetical protein